MSILTADVPVAEVLEDVPVYLKNEGEITPDEAVKRIDGAYQKYKQIEQLLSEQKTRLSAQIPEIEQSLKVLGYLHVKEARKESFKVSYMLNDQVYTKAKVGRCDKVFLWLGANVMVEYTLEDAQKMLQSNCSQVKNATEEVEKELSFIKDQITTTEVNIANVYNYGLRQKKINDQLSASS